MTKLIAICSFLFFSLAHAIKLNPEHLAHIKAVTERKDKDSYTLIAHLKDNTTMTYQETLSGENAGFATCDGTRLPGSNSSLMGEETDPHYWCALFQAKLKQLRGVKS